MDPFGHDLGLASTNAVRQDFQALIKDWWGQIGIEVELRNLDASVFFGGDPGSPDTFQKFYADVQMYANTFNGTDPQSYLGNLLCDKAPRPDSQWQGENISRWCMEEYDALHSQLTQTAGIEYGYNGNYDPHALPVRNARAITYTTQWCGDEICVAYLSSEINDSVTGNGTDHR